MQKVQTINVYRLAGLNSIRPCGELYNRHSVTAKRVKKNVNKIIMYVRYCCFCVFVLRTVNFEKIT